MPSFRIAISPSRRAATRFIGKVRRAIQQAIIEEKISQSELARRLGVHRSVINREIRGDKDITLGRVGELAYALGRKADFVLLKPAATIGSNVVVEAHASSTAVIAHPTVITVFTAKAA